MKKRKTLEDKKKELHEQAATALAAKKSKLQKETPPAPSESEIDMGVFSAKRGNLLEKIYIASTPQGVKSGKTFRKIDISKIMPPASPPSRAFDLSTPRDDLGGKEEQGNVEVKHVGEGGAADAGGAGGAGGAGDGGDGKKKISEEAEHERAASQKREEEYLQRIAKLEKFAEEKVAESKASELLAEEVTVDCKWLLARAVPLIAERITGSEELAKYVYKLGEVARDLGRKEGYAEGRAAAESKEPLKTFELYKTYCVARYSEK
ncbi:hypothetical protein HanPSC8_Chr16g0717771 [Helianthus annuus]|nr:hypothetical protein HanPSC8_Chr16g0717771 [Helianthus annuus]